MSAFVCSDLQTTVVALAYHQLIGHAIPVQVIAFALRDLNNDAVADRYRNQGEDDPVRLDWSADLERRAHAWMRTHKGPELASVVRCLRYQCSEGDCMQRGWFLTLDRFADTVERAAGSVSKDVYAIRDDGTAGL